MNAAAAGLLRIPATLPVATSGTTTGVPTRSEIDAWSTAVTELSTAAETFGAAANSIEIAADEHVQQLLTPGGTNWEGDAANAAQQQGFADRGVVYGAADLMRRMRKVASMGAGCIQQCRELALDAIAQAEADDFRVGDDLTVTDTHRYTSQQAGLYEARKVMATAHHGYIVMRAGNLIAEDVRVGSELSTGAAELAGQVPAEWIDDGPSSREASNGDGSSVQAYDTDSDGEGSLSGADIADRLRELQRGINRGVREVDTEEEIFDLYEELARGGQQLPTPDNYYDRRVLPDGTIIGIRESNTHGPTLDVNYPPGVSGPDKVHLPPPPITPPPTPPTPGEAPIIASPPNLPVIDHPPVPGLLPPWAQTPAGVPQGPLPSGGLPPGIGIAPSVPPPLMPSVESPPNWLPDVTLPSPTPEEQVGIGSALFGGLLAFLGWLGTPKVSF